MSCNADWGLSCWWQIRFLSCWCRDFTSLSWKVPWSWVLFKMFVNLSATCECWNERVRECVSVSCHWRYYISARACYTTAGLEHNLNSCFWCWSEMVRAGFLGGCVKSRVVYMSRLVCFLKRRLYHRSFFNVTALMFLMYRTLIHGVSAPCYWDTSEGVNYMSRYYYRHVNLREVLSKYNPRTAFTAWRAFVLVTDSFPFMLV